MRPHGDHPATHGLSKTTGERFALWLSRAWVDVVNNPDPEHHRRHELGRTALAYREGLRPTNPQRAAAYFCKPGMLAATEYEHDVPEHGRRQAAELAVLGCLEPRPCHP